MIVGVPKEIKIREDRVGMIPAGVRILTSHGHRVLIETGAGMGSGCSDDEYRAAGATIALGRDDLWKQAEMIVKVKEPLPDEYSEKKV